MLKKLKYDLAVAWWQFKFQYHRNKCNKMITNQQLWHSFLSIVDDNYKSHWVKMVEAKIRLTALANETKLA